MRNARPKILVLDDETNWRKIFERFNKKKGEREYEFLTFSNSKEILSYLHGRDKNELIHAAIVDYKLEGESGIDFIEKARDVGFYQPVILYSQHDIEGIDESAGQQNFRRYEVDYFLDKNLFDFSEATELFEIVSHLHDAMFQRFLSFTRHHTKEQMTLVERWRTHISNIGSNLKSLRLSIASAVSLSEDQADQFQRVDHECSHLIKTMHNDNLEILRRAAELYRPERLADSTRIFTDLEQQISITSIESRGLSEDTTCIIKNLTSMSESGKSVDEIVDFIDDSIVHWSAEAAVREKSALLFFAAKLLRDEERDSEAKYYSDSALKIANSIGDNMLALQIKIASALNG